MQSADRADPPYVGTEAEILLGFLDWHRRTLQLKTAGLDSAQLAARQAPSSMTLGGMLKHLAYVEDWWFSQVFAGNPEPEPWASVDWTHDRDWDWNSAAEDSPEELRALHEESVQASQRILRDALDAPEGLDAPAARRHHHRDPERTISLRWIVVHMIEEYARHNGHADLIRESIDGQVGE